MKHFSLLFLSWFCLLFTQAAASYDLPSPRVLILGDSIAFAGHWPTLIQAGLEKTPAYKNAYIVNLGLPSETVSGLSEEGHAGGAFPRPDLHKRLDRVLSAIKPDLIIACYGMNDGIYLPLDEVRFQAFKNGLARLKAEVEKNKGRIIFITPPLHQPDKAGKPQGNYDQTLDVYAKWMVAQHKNGWSVIDIRTPLRTSIEQEKAKSPDFVYAEDGVHPGESGHRMIADAIWPELASMLKLNPVRKSPEGEEYRLSYEKQNARKLAWLSETKHERPGIQAGVPVKLLPYAEKGMKISDWHGFVRLDFLVAGRPCLLVIPNKKAPGSSWIWRTEFFGHEPQADIALLKEGFGVAYMDVRNMYGSSAAINLMNQFYAYLVNELELGTKPVLEGFSRGGLFALNWAAANPGKVAALYLDAPVCDFKSWPGGKGTSKGSPDDWQRLLQVYGLTEDQAIVYKKNPVDNLQPLAKAKIPILSVVGDADDLVPVAENTGLLEIRYKKMHGPITVIHKPGIGHHPHSLKNPAPIVDFILKATKSNPVGK